jgi:DNA-binding response OmpR family regulator
MPLQPVSSNPLAGCRVLVVEDEYFLADDIVRALQALGAGVVGPCGELEDATRMLDDPVAIDAAIIDINLRSEMVFPLARLLKARSIPFVFATGYDRGSVDAEFQDIHLWEKPLDLTAMARDLTNLIRSR